jgi:hypothetical protein
MGKVTQRRDRAEELAHEVISAIEKSMSEDIDHATVTAAIRQYGAEVRKADAALCDKMDLDSYPDKKPFGHDFAAAIERMPLP